VESLFAIGNGYVGSRGSLAEGSPLSAPATFVAGVFNSDAGSVPGLARLADWTRLSLTVNGDPVRLNHGQNLQHRRILDMRQGMFWREWRHQDRGGRVTRLTEVRLASLADRHVLLQSIALTAENYSGTVTIDATTSGPLTLTTDRGIIVAMAVRTRRADCKGNGTGSTELPDHPVSTEIRLGETCRLDRVVAICTSREGKRRAPRSSRPSSVGRGAP